MREYIHQGIRIVRDDFRYFNVHAPVPWGDGPGENIYTFKTLKRAKNFIDGIIDQWNAARKVS